MPSKFGLSLDHWTETYVYVHVYEDVEDNYYGISIIRLVLDLGQPVMSRGGLLTGGGGQSRPPKRQGLLMHP